MIAFLYAGQGSQKVGMGQDLYNQFPLFKEYFDILTPEEKEIAFNGPLETLSDTEYTQPIMVAFAMGVTALLKEKGIVPSMVAGLSLGEYSALYAAGVFSKETAVELVRFRAKAMKAACVGKQTKMVAVLQLDRNTLAECVSEASSEGIVEIANFNCPGQIVIAGEENAVDKASELALAKGAKRCVPLNVSGPFHTSFMKPAGDALKEKFETTSFSPMQIPVLFNCLGKEKADQTIPELLEKQVQSSVYFEDTIQQMIDSGVDTIIEIGPGKTLSGFVKKVNKTIKLIQVEDLASLQNIGE